MHVKLELIAVNPDTGETSSAVEVPISAPTTQIVLESASLEPRPDQVAGKKLVRDIHLRGRVYSNVCGTVPGEGGAIKSIKCYRSFDTHIADIPLRVHKTESADLARPYPFEGSFDVRLPRTAMRGSSEVFTLRGGDPILGRQGANMFLFGSKKGPLPGVSHVSLGEPEPVIMTRDFFFCPLICRVHLDPTASSDGIFVHTLAGPRGIVYGADNYWYLADVAGAKPQVLVLLAGDTSLPTMRGEFAPSPFRNLLDRIAPNTEVEGDWFQTGFRAGFLLNELWLMAGSEKLATLALQPNALTSYEAVPQFAWDWGHAAPRFLPKWRWMGSSQAMLSPQPPVSALWLDKSAQVIFRDFYAKTGVGPFKLVVDEWKNLQMDGYPEEQREVLQYTPEVFDQYKSLLGATMDPAKFGWLCGQAYREMLSLFCPLGNPALAEERSILTKLGFLDLYKKASE